MSQCANSVVWKCRKLGQGLFAQLWKKFTESSLGDMCMEESGPCRGRTCELKHMYHSLYAGMFQCCAGGSRPFTQIIVSSSAGGINWIHIFRRV